jgi:benzoyl-CoA reductase/2-hydroxyglutaryl-CoA dehydratase subunit BcrC/BadD/HgdB
MRNDKTVIAIERVSNGFILTLPSDHESVKMVEDIFDRLKDFQGDINDDSDPVLKEIFKKHNKKDDVINLEKDNTMYIFSRLKDVLTFLTETFPDL